MFKDIGAVIVCAELAADKDEAKIRGKSFVYMR